ncbi:MAG: hypothetical protein H6739_12120 [Alphaproteobacteria bacterium]|nr:hypothetical protein [Alphaproteobacteria bacterium]
MLLLLLACAPKPDPDATVDTDWIAGAPLLSPLQENGTVALDGEVWVLGGYNSVGRTTARVEAYDPVADAWRVAADLPDRIHHANAAAFDGQLFVLGVLEGLSFEEVGAVLIYDPGTDTWAEGAAMNTPRAASAVGVIGDRVYVAGGLIDSEAVADFSAYIPAEDRWETLPPMPTARDHAGAGVVGGRLVVAGGRRGSIDSHMTTVEAWDPAAGTWESLAPLPASRGGIAAAVWDDRLYAIGGEGDPDDDHRVFDDVTVYDPAADVWAILDPMPTPRHGTGAVAVDGVLWVPGGATKAGLGPVDANEGLVVEP